MSRAPCPLDVSKNGGWTGGRPEESQLAQTQPLPAPEARQAQARTAPLLHPPATCCVTWGMTLNLSDPQAQITYNMQQGTGPESSSNGRGIIIPVSRVKKKKD